MLVGVLNADLGLILQLLFDGIIGIFFILVQDEVLEGLGNELG